MEPYSRFWPSFFKERDHALEANELLQHATVPVDQPLHLANILGASARNNRYEGITGVLAFADGIFIQAIEGPTHAVKPLWPDCAVTLATATSR